MVRNSGDHAKPAETRQGALTLGIFLLLLALAVVLVEFLKLKRPPYLWCRHHKTADRFDPPKGVRGMTRAEMPKILAALRLLSFQMEAKARRDCAPSNVEIVYGDRIDDCDRFSILVNL